MRYERAFGSTAFEGGEPMRIDTIFQIASMSKAIVSAAAMQLVERGQLSLDQPIEEVLPGLASPNVITGFDADGQTQVRAATRPITLRHLLTHTAGLGYAFVHADLWRHFAAIGIAEPGSMASITMPLLFDPGDRWDYSVATDWVGLAVEAASGETLGDYLKQNLFAPLGMKHTDFRDEQAMPPGAAQVFARLANGTLAPNPMNLGGGEFQSGGGGLSSTAPDYDRFLRMILGGGALDGHRVLAESTVATMTANAIGPLRAGYMPSALPDFAPPYDPFPDQHSGWSVGGFLINPERGPNGRSAGSLHWAGIFNSYYWADPATGIAGIFMGQLLPFGDPATLAAFGALERMAYR